MPNIKLLLLFLSIFSFMGCSSGQKTDSKKEVSDFLAKYPPAVSDSIYTAFDLSTPASFPGGNAQLSAFLDDYQLALNFNPKGPNLIVTKFIVEKNGSISNIEILSGKSEDIKKKVEKALRNFPQWLPALIGGKIVRSELSLPIVPK